MRIFRSLIGRYARQAMGTTLAVMEVTRRYDTIVTKGARGRVMVPVPFDPDQVWGPKPQHHVAGTVNGMGVRAVIEHSRTATESCSERPGGATAVSPPAIGSPWPSTPRARRATTWPTTCATPSRPNRTPAAFFDSLAQFYRRAYLKWIDSTKRRPDVRVERIQEVIGLLKQGIKQRPGT